MAIPSPIPVEVSLSLFKASSTTLALLEAYFFSTRTLAKASRASFLLLYDLSTMIKSFLKNSFNFTLTPLS